jgi:hypothetical protein
MKRGTGMAARQPADPELGFIAFSRGSGTALGALALRLTLAVPGADCTDVRLGPGLVGVDGTDRSGGRCSLCGAVDRRVRRPPTRVLTWDKADLWRLSGVAGAALPGLALRRGAEHARQGCRGGPSMRRAAR